MSLGRPSSWPGQVIRAVGVVVLVAVGARVVYEVLSSILSWLLVLIVLATIYAVLLGTLRRR
jgi:uncharacterized membrane protein YfcA